MLKDHVWSYQAGRKAVITAELTRIRGAREFLPIVAASYTERIVLYHWRERIAMWGWAGIDHRCPVDPDRGKELFESPEISMMDQLSRLGWCHRLGLAAGDEYVFLAYKRSLDDGKPQLYLDLYRLTDGGDSLERVSPSPIALPLKRMGVQRTGYYLWMCFAEADSGDPDASDKLVILTQTFASEDGPAALAYLATDSFRNPTSLTDPNSWQLEYIGDRVGGYDLDAMLVGDEIHCIYRLPAYPASFSFIPGEGVDEQGGLDVSYAQYEPLVYSRIRAQDGGVLDTESDLPGGEHPQLQSIDPLAYTADRLSEGSLVMDPSSSPPALRYEVSLSRKNLFLRVDGDWTTTRLMEIDETRYADSPIADARYWNIVDPILYLPGRNTQVLKIARPCGLLPVFACRFEWADEVLDLDLLHHNRDLQALVMTRLRHEPLAYAFAAPDLSRYAVLNINHEDLPDCFETTPLTTPENSQYWPFELEPIEDKDGAFSWSLRPATDLLFSTGGDLSAERIDGLPSSYTFVHPADGGIRLIQEFDPARVSPVTCPSDKVLDPDAVTGAGKGAWRQVEQNGDWSEFTIGVDDEFYYQGATFFAGLDNTLNALFTGAKAGQFGTLSTDEKEVTLTLSEALLQPEGLEVWNSLWEIRNQINDDTAASSDLIRDIGKMSIAFSKYTLTWELVPHRLVVLVSDSYRTQFRLKSRQAGQGRIEGRFLLDISLPEVRLTDWLNPLATTTIEVELDYRRNYSPALLMKDRRKNSFHYGSRKENLDRGSRHDAVAFTAKPIGDSSMGPIDVSPVFEWTVSGHALVWILPALVVLLSGLGLGWLATALTGLAAKAAAEAASLIGLIVAAGTYAALVTLLETTVPKEIEKAVSERLANYDFKTLLDENGLLMNAGEGIAEELAYRVLTAPEREAIGENRFKQGLWRLVFVTQRLCRILTETAP